jgi:nondiscriminating glutamyl-tRNA synthetase
MSQSKVRVRFAPSPTGYLHVGGARTALYNYLFAKHHKGTFVLRIEDTDEARSTDEALRMQIEDLQWMGLQWDEGPDPKTLQDVGSKGPYRQSRRKDIYKKLATELIDSGKAYYCFMTDAEIDAQREILQKTGKAPHVESPYADWTLAQAQEHISKGHVPVVRFRTKHLRKDYIFKDLVRGEVKFPSDMVGDFVMLRSGGMPVYNFCNVIDDHMMDITHVLRAEEHLPNTLRQLMLYEAFGWTPPEFGHLSIILDEDRKKLSKRKGATSCHEFKMEGYTPDGLLNFLSLLGWSHPEGKEIFDRSELIEKFSLERLHPAGAVFDAVKLKWVNATHVRALPNEQIWQEIQPFLARENLILPENKEWQMRSVEVFKSALETLADAIELYRPLADKSFAIQPEAQEVVPWPESKAVWQAWKELLEKETSDYLTEARFLELQDLVKVNAKAKGKTLFQPLRVAVIGKPHGTELKILMPLISRKSLIERAQMCLEKLV